MLGPSAGPRAGRRLSGTGVLFIGSRLPWGEQAVGARAVRTQHPGPVGRQFGEGSGSFRRAPRLPRHRARLCRTEGWIQWPIRRCSSNRSRTRTRRHSPASAPSSAPPRSRLCQPSQRGQGPRRESTRRQRPAQPARQQSSGQNDLHRQCALFRPRLTPHVHTASFTPRSRHRAYTRPPTLTGGSIARARFAVSTMGKQRSGPGRLRSAPTGRCPRPRVDPAASHQVGPAAQQRQYKALLASLISKPPPHTSGADSTADAIQPSSETSTPYAWG